MYNTATSTAWSFNHETPEVSELDEEALGELLMETFRGHYQYIESVYKDDGPQAVIEFLFDPWDTSEV